MSLFDGVTGLFEGVFDEPVTITRQGQQPVDARGIYRDEPGVQADLDGVEVLVSQPVLKLRKPDADGLARNDRIEVASRPGVVLQVLTVQPGRSPATDKHVIVILGLVEA